ncbi:hypothetical protein E2562_002818 [Oryza meyeriana var. granulata]|uniref:C2H2-type domain-containing protein n=1 Tax=Oryza meyeriana var. granulata TaxID=110450 RepID=A0A6G1BQ06_9ORYZ|nr:hypothetical protein E2562_002818 [Oryza meyeriana var. granulata]KAF0890445.1 hypothetical protein E2562_002818 [Oryza meyeriana var. granulata]
MKFLGRRKRNPLASSTVPMLPPFSHLRCRPLAAIPNLLFRQAHSLPTSTTPATRAPTTPVAVLWDLAASRPPSTLPFYDAAVRLHLAAASFGRVRLSAAFVHPGHRLPAPSPAAAATAHLCRVCGRRFRARDTLLRHFDAIHTREHAKRLARIDSSRGDRRVRLAAALSLKLSKYEKAVRELTAAADPCSPADDLRRARVVVELSRTPSDSLLERAHDVLDEGSVGCLMLVSGRDELAPLLRLARENGVRSVVVGGESGPARWADVGFSWAEVIAGKARKAAPSVSGKWRDRDVLKRLEWRYEDDDDEDEQVVFEEDGDEDEIDELARKTQGKPWWKLESDGEDSRISS